MRFLGKNILVTGGTRGIGRAIAEDFKREGGRVAIFFNSSFEKAKELESSGFLVFKCDVSKREEVKKAKQIIEKEFNRLDVLVNNSGIMHLMNFEDFDEEKYEEMLRVNLNGTIYTTLEFLPLLKKSRNAAIINIASNAGIGTALEGTTFYAITKAGVIILTKRLAFELGKYGIRVNSVAPGWVETDLTLKGRKQEEIEELRKRFRERTSLRRTGSPEEISKIVLFLASEESSYITGQVIVADGGRVDNLTHSL